MTLHDNEFAVDDDLVRRLNADQMPQWSDLPLRRFDTSGTVNWTYRLGDDKVVRLPRTPDSGKGPMRESQWMPVFAPLVSISVPTYLALGLPTSEYPSHWSVLEWVEGEAANQQNLSKLHDAATVLGEFVTSMRGVPTDGAPEGGNYRAFGLGRVDKGFHQWIEQQPEDIERGPLLAIWEKCLAVGSWTDAPRWLHSDLRGENLIVRNGELVAVIDWEGCTVGDPSADCLAAWWLFDGDSRETFRTASKASQSDWMRAKGWALLMAVAAIPYYTETNPLFASQARTALHQILSDDY